MHILIIGSGTREHCIAWKLAQSKHHPDISCFGSHKNPGIKPLCTHYIVGTGTDPEAVTTFAKEIGTELAIVGPEAPLATGVADALRDAHIPTVGPRQLLAQLETSKAFTRRLVQKYFPEANPACKHFSSMDGVKGFIIDACTSSFVIKHDGLKGGKGVLVMGDHFETIQEGLQIGEDIIAAGESFLIEEKLIGQEFSLFSFNDGVSLKHSFAIQDHKRAYVGDIGPNTGGMGTYSDSNHSLPFLAETDIAQAKEINEKVARALQQEYPDLAYQGIMYGGFMATASGVKLIEYNARFGDPEVFNLLTLMDTDLVDLFLGIVQQTLTSVDLAFSAQASVCKYLVPSGYPNNPVKGGEITVGELPSNIQYFYGSVEQVDEQEEKFITLGSRAIALIARGESIGEAEQNVSQAMTVFSGPLEHRADIGTKELIEKRIDMMRKLRN